MRHTRRRRAPSVILPPMTPNHVKQRIRAGKAARDAVKTDL